MSTDDRGQRGVVIYSLIIALALLCLDIAAPHILPCADVLASSRTLAWCKFLLAVLTPIVLAIMLNLSCPHTTPLPAPSSFLDV